MTPAYVSGDTNGDGKLDLTETWIYTASGTAITGNYSNTGTASGSYTDSAGHSRTDTATDASSYFGADPQIAIDKVTVDGTTSGDGLNILTGESISWRYTVTNVGNVPLSNVTVTDSKAGVTPAYVSGDTNGDGKLDLTETWIYAATRHGRSPATTATPARPAAPTPTAPATAAPTPRPTAATTSAPTRRSPSSRRRSARMARKATTCSS